MGTPAARVGDDVPQAGPHCQAPVHPAAVVPRPAPHPALPPATMPPGGVTVAICGEPSVCMGDMTEPCTMPGGVPAGPAVIMPASAILLIFGRPAARGRDMALPAGCVAPIASPERRILPPGCPTIGG